MTIGERFKIYIKAESTSMKALATACDLPYTTLAQYVADRRSPNAESLVKLILHTRMNINWLLTGIGDVFREAKDGPVYQGSPGQAPSKPYVKPMGAAQAAAVAEGQQAWIRLKLGEAAILGGAGPLPLARRILHILAAGHPKPLELEIIQSKLCREGEAFDDKELMTSIIFLMSRGLIQEASEFGRTAYQLTDNLATLEFGGREQASHMSVEAIGTLLNEIAPAALASRGKVVSAVAYVPEGRGRDLLKQIYDLIENEWKETVASGGSELTPGSASEELNLVLGLSVGEHRDEVPE